MLKGYSSDELYEMGRNCLKKYEKKQEDVIMKAITGEIKTHGQMVRALKDLNIEYLIEMEDYDLCPLDLNPGLIDYFKKADEAGESLIDKAKFYLGLFDISDEALNNGSFVCEDGVCDENGHPLCDDGEHRPFDVIKGGLSKD